MSSQRKPITQSAVLLGGLSTLENKENLNAQEIREMVDLLKAYETLCIQREDFSGAEGVKNKIEQLKSQELLFRKSTIAVREKEHIEVVCKEGEEEIRRFQEVWDAEVQKLIAELKEVEDELTAEHRREMQAFVGELQKEEAPRIKFSSLVLERRKYLSNLIKARNYRQAEVVKNQLKELQAEQQGRWAQRMAQKKQLKLQKLQKKQVGELQALRVKLQALFNEKIKERDRKFEILLKKNRKRRIESSKPSRERIRSRNGVLTDSKLNFNSTSNQ